MGILVQLFGPKGRIAAAASGSSYLPHGKEHVKETKNTMNLSIWSEFP